MASTVELRECLLAEKEKIENQIKQIENFELKFLKDKLSWIDSVFIHEQKSTEETKEILSYKPIRSSGRTKERFNLLYSILKENEGNWLTMKEICDKSDNILNSSNVQAIWMQKKLNIEKRKIEGTTKKEYRLRCQNQEPLEVERDLFNMNSVPV